MRSHTCLCSHPEAVHEIGGDKQRTKCSRSGCGCATFRPADAPERPCPTCGRPTAGEGGDPEWR